MQHKVSKVVILGGGTAGWMTAALLSKALSKVDITVVESEQIGTIGVGEATIPSLHFFNDMLGVNSSEFIKKTSGSFKLGIQFENWRKPGESYFHGFGSTGLGMWAAGFHEYWQRGIELGISKPFGCYNLETQAALQGKFAHLQGGPNFAYHLDASLYANLLRDKAISQGVKRQEGLVNHVQTNPDNGYINALELQDGPTVEADFFIDCSGFKGLLIDETLKTPFVDWSHWLPMNRAIAVQTELATPPLPYTRSIAHKAGWQWRIPLQHRMGNGIVYGSDYMSDDEARDTLVTSVEGKMLTEPRMLKFKTGHRKTLWNKNCIAIGLAGGFIEPLESTAIHLIQQGILQLIKYFPTYGINQLEVDEYNYYMETDYNEIKDFIVLHYKQTDRNDSPFWQFCQEMKVPPSLQQRMDMFKQTGRFVQRKNEIFNDSWLQVMIGQGLIPDNHHPIADELSESELKRFLDDIEQDIQKKVVRLPNHADYLKRIS
ncbi:tryptophan 7-halogenase [Psychrosphaera sp. B3R10]|uniref:tryptophan halogenase family protein n=1 Tax=unclassified Psychrosphaera TaxID=2641570 RepID=UPI001C089D44|nr:MULTISPECIES: tryptophan halogenase family protein [unclassified Psychrosphaera]MBU2880819.1 tryptophan 7-halogenase [Psychrosphaera sp. I2R16]MBU2990962.1 tryptophan 7-halogenase [Psychrosphaera sp. B3R10]